MAPKTELFATLVGNAFAIAVVGFAIAISLGKIFALRHGYRVDSNQVCAEGLELEDMRGPGLWERGRLMVRLGL